MKNKFLIILGFLFMLGMVSASTQTYDVEVTLTESGGSSSDILLSYTSPQNEVVSNPINFNLNVNYNDTDALNCDLVIDGNSLGNAFGIGSFDNINPITLNSNSNIDWEFTCVDSIGIENTTSGTFNVEDVNLTFGEIEDGDFYFNDSIINGTLGFTKDIEFLLDGGLIDSGDISFDENTGDFSLNIDAPGYHTLTAATNYFSDIPDAEIGLHVGYATISFEYPTAAIDEDVGVYPYVNLGGLSGYYYNILIGNQGSGYSSIDSGANIPSNNEFSSSTPGTYTARLDLVVNGVPYNITSQNSLTVSGTGNVNDDEDPVITMIYPAWEQVITDSEIEFTYEIEDNIDLAWCKLKIYNATETSGIYMEDELVFPLTSSDVDLAEENPTGTSDEINLKLVDFDEGGYIWKVECEDGAGNDDNDYNYFYVDLSGTYAGTSTTSGANEYEREAEVQDLIDKINLFLESEGSFGIDEKRAVELLGIDANMGLYKKKLLQIDQDLKYNLRFMSADKYDERVDEIDDEIDEIRNNIILGITIGDTYEYSKSNPSISMEEIIGSYFDASGHKVGASTLKRLARSNTELQNKLSSRVEAIKLEIEYVDKTKELIVVNKKLDIDSNFQDTLLEFIPEDLNEEVSFVSNAEDIGNGIWEVNVDGLDNDELTYYFYSDLSLQKIEKTESVLFSEDMGEGSFITGFVVGVGDSLGVGILPILIGALFMGYVGFLIFGKARMEVWKKEPNVVRILDLMKNTKLLLKENSVVDARANYVKMGEIYKVLPNKTKSFFFNEIKMIRLAIDKKDVINLMKEYEQAKNAGRTDDASELHAKISAVYKKLPKKFQEKVYQRLIKNEIK